jgi:hypothetical protein
VGVPGARNLAPGLPGLPGTIPTIQIIP